MSGQGPEAAACVTTQAPAHGVRRQSVKAGFLVNEVNE